MILAALPRPCGHRDQRDVLGGALIGTIAEYYILNHFSDTVNWRIGFLIGPALALFVLYVRRNLPESPRWLIAIRN